MDDVLSTLEGERLELRYIRLDQAVLWDQNPKQHDLGQLVAAIRRYGFQDPPKFDATLGALVYGNGRTHALMMMHKAHEPLPRGILRDQEGHWYLPVKFGLDLESQAVARAFALDHNNLTMAGGDYSPLDMARMWNLEVYNLMLTDLAAADLLPVSVDGDDLDLLLAYRKTAGQTGEESGSGEKVPVTSPEQLRKKWSVKPGQIWEIPSQTVEGECHRLMCGDSTNNSDVEILMAGMKAQGSITSPPYAAQRAEKYGGPKPKNYLNWWEPIQANIRLALADDGCFFLNIKPHSDEGERETYVFELVLAMKQRWAWAFIDELCWLKPAVPGDFKYRFRNGFEPIYHFAVAAKQFKFRPDNVKHLSEEVPITQGPGHGEKDWSKIQGEGLGFFPQGDDLGLARPTNVMSYPHYEPARGHPATYPVEVPEFFIRAFSDEGDLWLDSFVGSGSTIVAAERNGRLAYGIDLKPEYVAVTLERLSELGLEPTLPDRADRP